MDRSGPPAMSEGKVGAIIQGAIFGSMGLITLLILLAKHP
jgi:hypothetical protein